MADRKIQVVTGGTSGMGKATAIALGKFGPVMIGGRNEARLAEALKEVKAAGVEAYGHRCDVSDHDSLAEFAAASQEVAPIGNVVHAAGIDSNGGDSAKILAVNMGGTINVDNVFLPLMDHSALVNFTSVTGYFYQPGPDDLAIWNEATSAAVCEPYLAYLEKRDLIPGMEWLGRPYLAYAASKSFCIYHTKANATRYAKRGCQIFSIAPGTFYTPMLQKIMGDHATSAGDNTPMGRVGTPEEMADLIQKLLEPGHEYLTGCDIVMDGGLVAGQMAKQLA